MSGLFYATLGAQTLQKTMLEQEEAAYASRMKQARAELRDRFAMAALTGLLASPSECEGKSKNPLERYSKRAYQYADAMMATREENSQ